MLALPGMNSQPSGTTLLAFSASRVSYLELRAFCAVKLTPKTPEPATTANYCGLERGQVEPSAVCVRQQPSVQLVITSSGQRHPVEGKRNANASARSSPHIDMSSAGSMLAPQALQFCREVEPSREMGA